MQGRSLLRLLFFGVKRVFWASLSEPKKTRIGVANAWVEES